MKNIKENNIENLFLFFWTGILLSINSTNNDLIHFYELNYNLSANYFLTVINFFRFIFPFFLLLVLLIFFFIKKKKINLLNFIFLLFFFWQLIVYFISGLTENLLNNIQLICSSVSVLLIFNLVESYNFKNFYSKILNISLAYIFVISIFLTAGILFEKNILSLKYIYWTEFLNPSISILNQATPRITGLSRMLVIILFAIFVLLTNLKKIKNYYKILLYLTLICLNLIIYIMQSRGSFIGVFLIYFLFFSFYSLQLSKKFLFFFTTLVIPILIYEGIYSINYSNKSNIINKRFTNNRILPEYKNNNFTYFKSSSGRIEIWTTAIKLIKEKKILIGMGPQADRLLLGEYTKMYHAEKIQNDNNKLFIWDNNVSNGFLYSYLCAGVFGIILLLIIYTIIIKEIYINIFNKKKLFFKEWTTTFATITITYLALRTVYENGFTVFGIDFIFLIILCNIIFKKNNLIKNY